MVKAFRNLQSLVVRVGQPKEEPPSWARCMRYAEIGGSVEKFMFMAAKCGDFSELDATLLGLADMGDKLEVKAWITSSSPAPLEAVVHTDMDRHDLTETSSSSISTGEVDTRNIEAWSDVESDEEGGQRGLHKSTDYSSFDIGEREEHEKRYQYSRLTPFDASFLLERGQRKPLSQFNLRQVIAPSNDVLKRMLPVIHFAIVQGLNELRDSLPRFVAMFAELRSFLLVDMAESITVFMREHHIQELKSLYLQDWDGSPSQVKEALKVEAGSGSSRGDEQAKCASGRGEEEEPTAAGKANRSHSEVLGPRHVNCTEVVADMDETGANDKQVDDTLVITQVREDEVEDRQDLTVSMNEGWCSRSRVGSCFSSVLSTCKLPLLKSTGTKASEACKGKEKLLEYQDLDLHREGRPSASNSLHMDSWRKDYNSPAGTKDPVDGSVGGCSFLPFSKSKADKGDLITTSLAGLKYGQSDVQNSYQGVVSAHPSAHEALLKPCSACLSPLKAVDDSMSCTKEHAWSSDSDTELEESKDSSVMNFERGMYNKQAHFSNVEGQDGKRHCQYGKMRENGYRLQGVRFTRDAKVDLTSKHLSKRCHRSDSLRKPEFCKSPQYPAGLKSLYSGDSVEDGDVRTSEIPIFHDGLDKNKHSLKDEVTLAGSENDDSLAASCSSVVVDANNGGVVCGTCARTDGDDINSREAVENGSIEGFQQNEGHPASDQLGDSRILPWEAHENAGERVLDADAWRHVWQERVRRLRDSLRVAPGQELEWNHEDLRGRSRDRLRKRHQAMEKDALSFNYTFWRAEQVSSCNYVMSDISMCIATHAAQTLGEAEKEVLLQAAIAGPLLVATVSHVNKHYNCHNL